VTGATLENNGNTISGTADRQRHLGNMTLDNNAGTIEATGSGGTLKLITWQCHHPMAAAGTLEAKRRQIADRQ